MKRVLSILVIGFSLATATLAAENRVITTSGRGVVDAAPDMASLSVGVTHQATDAEDALMMTSEAVRDVIAQLEGLGIAARDMQTQGLSLQPVWSRPQGNAAPSRTITGFVASNALTIRVRDLATLGTLLDAVVSDGANTFNGLQFSLQDPEAAIAEARSAAVADAMAKAAQLADAAGVALGPVQSISENGATPRPVMMEMSSARMASDVPVAPGEVSLSAQITMVFAIAE